MYVFACKPSNLRSAATQIVRSGQMVRNLSQLCFGWHIFCCQTDESKEKLMKKGKKGD
jgi:hypothetical protein